MMKVKLQKISLQTPEPGLWACHKMDRAEVVRREEKTNCDNTDARDKKKIPPVSEAGQPSYKVIASNVTGLNILPEIAAFIKSNHARGHVGTVMATPEESV